MVELNGEVPMIGQNQALEAGLIRNGVLCIVCKRLVCSMGDGDVTEPLEYLRVEPKMQPGKPKPVVVSTKLVVCGREDCDHSEVAAGADAVRPFIPWQVLAVEEMRAPADAAEQNGGQH